MRLRHVGKNGVRRLAPNFPHFRRREPAFCGPVLVDLDLARVAELFRRSRTHHLAAEYEANAVKPYHIGTTSASFWSASVRPARYIDCRVIQQFLGVVDGEVTLVTIADGPVRLSIEFKSALNEGVTPLQPRGAVGRTQTRNATREKNPQKKTPYLIHYHQSVIVLASCAVKPATSRAFSSVISVLQCAR